MLFLWIIVLAMLGVLILSWWKPDWFKKYVESVVGGALVTVISFFNVMLEYLQTDTTWHELVSKENLPIAVTAVGVLFLLLKFINGGRRR